MKKTAIIFILSLFLLQSCKNETKPIVEKTTVKTVKEDGFCYLNDIKQTENKLIAKIDFIEYQKTSEIDSTLKLDQIIELPNGFCYVNENPKLEEVEISDTALVIMQTFSYDNEGNFNFNQKIKLNELVELFKNPEGDRIKFSPFRLKLKNKIITSLTEIYIP